VSFCSRTDLVSHQPAAGTGVRAEAYVFLPVPKRLWRAKEMNESWASSEDLAAIAAARRGGVVTRLYNPPRDAHAADTPILVHAAEGRPRPEALDGLLTAFGSRWPVEPQARPRLAICTHGTRDRCCAKWGYAAYTTARRLFDEGRSPYEPIECSHLGGDRFAATGIVFPSGSMYAHLDSVDLAALTASEAAGRLRPDTYRGRVFEGPLAQIVRQGLAREGVFDAAAAPIRVRRASPEATEAEATLPDGRRFRIELQTLEVTFFASCEKLHAHKAAAGRRLAFAGAELIVA
jgi:hypothetical protein